MKNSENNKKETTPKQLRDMIIRSVGKHDAIISDKKKYIIS